MPKGKYDLNKTLTENIENNSSLTPEEIFKELQEERSKNAGIPRILTGADPLSDLEHPSALEDIKSIYNDVTRNKKRGGTPRSENLIPQGEVPEGIKRAISMGTGAAGGAMVGGIPGAIAGGAVNYFGDAPDILSGENFGSLVGGGIGNKLAKFGPLLRYAQKNPVKGAFLGGALSSGGQEGATQAVDKRFDPFGLAASTLSGGLLNAAIPGVIAGGYKNSGSRLLNEAEKTSPFINQEPQDLVSPIAQKGMKLSGQLDLDNAEIEKLGLGKKAAEAALEAANNMPTRGDKGKFLPQSAIAARNKAISDAQNSLSKALKDETDAIDARAKNYGKNFLEDAQTRQTFSDPKTLVGYLNDKAQSLMLASRKGAAYPATQQKAVDQMKRVMEVSQEVTGSPRRAQEALVSLLVNQYKNVDARPDNLRSDIVTIYSKLAKDIFPGSSAANDLPKIIEGLDKVQKALGKRIQAQAGVRPATLTGSFNVSNILSAISPSEIVDKAIHGGPTWAKDVGLTVEKIKRFAENPMASQAMVSQAVKELNDIMIRRPGIEDDKKQAENKIKLSFGIQ